MSFSSLMNDFLFSTEGKLATIWFDELLLEPSSIDIDTIGNVCIKRNVKQNIIDELLKIWKPQKIDNYKFLDYRFKEDVKGLNTKTEKAVIEEIGISSKEELNKNPGLLKELAWQIAGFTNSINVWLEIHNSNSCVYIPGLAQERKILEDVFCKSYRKKEFEIFSNYTITQIPTLDNYSWEEILEIRHNPYFENFRKKLAEINRNFDSYDEQEITDVIEQLYQKDQLELVKFIKPPTSGKLILKAILPNLPMPPLIPNPLSIFYSGLEIKKILDIKKRFGWIYFLIDLKENSSIRC